MRKPLGLRPLCPKLPNPRLGLAPTPPGPSLKPAPQSSAAARPRPQPLAPYPETPPPADPVLRNQAPPSLWPAAPSFQTPPSAPTPAPAGPAPNSTRQSTLHSLAALLTRFQALPLASKVWSPAWPQAGFVRPCPSSGPSGHLALLQSSCWFLHYLISDLLTQHRLLGALSDYCFSWSTSSSRFPDLDLFMMP